MTLEQRLAKYGITDAHIALIMESDFFARFVALRMIREVEVCSAALRCFAEDHRESDLIAALGTLDQTTTMSQDLLHAVADVEREQGDRVAARTRRRQLIMD